MKKLIKATLFATILLALIYLVGILSWALGEIGLSDLLSQSIAWFVTLVIVYLLIGK